ncbi:hypothetical protein RUND412_010006 [Rhizina undulata]
MATNKATKRKESIPEKDEYCAFWMFVDFPQGSHMYPVRLTRFLETTTSLEDLYNHIDSNYPGYDQSITLEFSMATKSGRKKPNSYCMNLGTRQEISAYSYIWDEFVNHSFIMPKYSSKVYVKLDYVANPISTQGGSSHKATN